MVYKTKQSVETELVTCWCWCRWLLQKQHIIETLHAPKSPEKWQIPSYVRTYPTIHARKGCRGFLTRSKSDKTKTSWSATFSVHNYSCFHNVTKTCKGLSQRHIIRSIRQTSYKELWRGHVANSIQSGWHGCWSIVVDLFCDCLPKNATNFICQSHSSNQHYNALSDPS